MPSWNQLLYQFVSGLKEEKEEEAEQGGKRKNKKEMEREEKLREGIVVLLNARLPKSVKMLPIAQHIILYSHSSYFLIIIITYLNRK